MTLVSIETLQDLVTSAMGQPAQSLRMLTAGTVNQTVRFHVDGAREYILRIAPDAETAAAGPAWLTDTGLRREQAAFDLLGDLRDRLPETVYTDFTRERIERDWVIQTVVTGAPFSGIRGSFAADEMRDLFRQVGEICARIHAVRGGWFGPPSDGERYPAWADLLEHDIAGFTHDAARWDLPVEPYRAFADEVRAAREALSDVPPTLIHSDLSLDHLFVARQDDAWRISGVIDLEFARFADPLSEGLLLEMLQRSDPVTDAFFTGYGGRPEVSPLRIDIATRLMRAWAETDAARLASPQRPLS